MYSTIIPRTYEICWTWLDTFTCQGYKRQGDHEEIV